MSAFVVGKAHIDALLTAAMAQEPGEHRSGLSWRSEDPKQTATFAEREVLHRDIGCLDNKRADEVGQMLWEENFASVLFRYADCMPDYVPGPVPVPVPADYRFERGRRLSAVAVLKAIDCYEYQSCEHPEWVGSEAKQFCESLRQKVIRLSPGYREAEWEIRGRHIWALGTHGVVAADPLVEVGLTLGPDSADVLADLLCPLLDRGYRVQITLENGQRHDRELCGYTFGELLVKDWCDGTGGAGRLHAVALSQVVAIHIY